MLKERNVSQTKKEELERLQDSKSEETMRIVQGKSKSRGRPGRWEDADHVIPHTVSVLPSPNQHLYLHTRTILQKMTMNCSYFHSLVPLYAISRS